MIAGVLGLALVWVQRYQAFEKFVTVLVLIKFVSVVSVAILVAPDLSDLANGLVPRLPDGSIVYVLGLIGGVGGTITMAAYGYWMIAKGWKGTGWLSMMRLDNAVGYIMTAIFVIAMLIVGAEMLLGQDIVSGDSGLLVLGNELGTRYGEWARILFLVGFLAVTTTSLLGVWNGVSLLFTDWTRIIRLPHGAKAEVGAGERTEGAAPSDATETGYTAAAAERSTPFRAYLLWLTIPPMALLFFDQPFALTLVYGVLGAAFMPFLGLTLLLLLNSKRVAREGRSGWFSNVLLVAASSLFVVLLVTELIRRFG
jgi:Mn2+/Fe2+ NRAMP family transporter